MSRHESKESQAQYVRWKKSVKRRDGYKCQWAFCNCTTKLQIHHVLEWSKFPHLRYDVNNGITLCKQHHSMIKGNEALYAPLFSNIIIEKIKNAKQRTNIRRTKRH